MDSLCWDGIYGDKFVGSTYSIDGYIQIASSRALLFCDPEHAKAVDVIQQNAIRGGLLVAFYGDRFPSGIYTMASSVAFVDTMHTDSSVRLTVP
jgi:hypothetical protein